MSKLLVFCAAAAFCVATAPAAMADASGTAEVTLSSGGFTYNPSPVLGSDPVTGGFAYETFAANFAYTNSLPDPSSVSHYIGSATVSDVNGGLFSESQDFGSTSLNTLEDITPLAGQLTTFVTLVAAGTTQGTAEIGGFTFSYIVSASGGSTTAAGSGSFVLFGDVNYSGPEATSGTDADGFPIVTAGNPGDLPLGSDTGISATLSLTAIPEPASMALLGAGLAGLGMIRRRRRS